MNIRKPIEWTVESRHEKTCSSRGKRAWGSELTSVKRTVGCRWIDIGNIVIKLALALGFVFLLCTFSCGVRTTFTKEVEDEVRKYREEIAQFQGECRNLLGVTNEISVSYGKIVAFRKSVEEATRRISVLTNRVAEVTNDIEFRLKAPLCAYPMFCPCCWRLYD